MEQFVVSVGSGASALFSPACFICSYVAASVTTAGSPAGGIEVKPPTLVSKDHLLSFSGHALCHEDQILRGAASYWRVEVLSLNYTRTHT